MADPPPPPPDCGLNMFKYAPATSLSLDYRMCSDKHGSVQMHVLPLAASFSTDNSPYSAVCLDLLGLCFDRR